MSEEEFEEYLQSRSFEKLNERVMEHWDMIAGNKNLPVEARAFIAMIYRLGYSEAVIDTCKLIEEVSKIHIANGGK